MDNLIDNKNDVDAASRHVRPESGPSSAATPKRSIRIQSQFSLGFGQWLKNRRIGLVCSTYQTGHLLFLGLRPDGMPVASAAGFSRAMGIAVSSRGLFVGANKEIWRLQNVLQPHELESGLFDRLFVPRTAHLTGTINIHELAIEESGRLVFVNARFSCLATLSDSQSFKPIWKPKFISRLAPEDRCHLNGVGTENGSVRFVTACAASDSVEGWRSQRSDGGLLIDISDDRVLADGLSMPHSPRVAGDHIYFIESGRGHLVRVDRGTGKRETITFCPGFGRGLAILDHYAILTISLPRSFDFEGLPIAEEAKSRGATPWCGLLIINLDNGDIIEWLRLEGDVSELFDVAIIKNVRCPRALSPFSPELDELVRADENN